jgi:hypothetical protein
MRMLERVGCEFDADRTQSLVSRGTMAVVVSSFLGAICDARSAKTMTLHINAMDSM